MLGAIIGDVVGSKFEFKNTNRSDFELFHDASTFTDDTVLLCATADSILNGTDYGDNYQLYYFKYPNRGYGGSFVRVASAGKLRPYNSYGNGSAMRISPVGWAFDTLEETLEEAKKSAEVTHNHPEGIKGAQAVALAIYKARHGADKMEIIKSVSDLGYDLGMTIKDIPRQHKVTCQDTIPICMALFSQTEDFENAIRKTIQAGGDVDTNACIVGSMAEAFYGQSKIARDIQANVFKKITPELADIVVSFIQKYINPEYKKPSEMSEAEELKNSIASLFSTGGLS